MTGSEFVKLLLAGNLFGIERELAILSAARSSVAGVGGGGLWSTVTSTATIAGKSRTLKMQCSPLPFSIGTNSDPFLCPAWPWTYQILANGLDAVMPTRRMCTLVAKQAELRIAPQPFPLTNAVGKPDGGRFNETSARYAQSNKAILSSLVSASHSPGELISGAKKDVVTGPNLNGEKVAIFGWFHKDGPQSDTKEGRWQPYSTIHESEYSDYSHGWRVFRRKAMLDGSPVDLNDISTDKLLHVLVSDQGAFPLSFPNSSPAVATPPGYPLGAFSRDPGGKGGGTDVTVTPRKGRAVGGAVFGGVVGFVVGGPVGGAVGALLGGALART